MIEFKLFRRGRTHLPIYDVVVAEKRKKNGGEFIAKVGVYDPLHPSKSFLREDVVMLWLSYGARMTTKVHDIMSKAGIFKKLYNQKENQSDATTVKNQSHATTVKNHPDATTLKNQPHATTVKNQPVKKEEDNSRTAVTKD
jgi:small subunit ribosomal protein S16